MPGRGDRTLGDVLRRAGLDPRAALLLALALCGVVVALGAHTPFYRFLVQTFGTIFRAIRAPSRGIVLFDLALSVLAAWGLSLLTRRRPTGARITAAAAAMALLVVEFRAFPLPLVATPGEPAPVYAWLRAADFPGAVVEWPLGIRHDFEYVLRQATHEKPLVNGYSGFFPRGYDELAELLRKRPIPDVVWEKLEALDARLVVLHMDSREVSGLELLEYVRFVRRGIAEGRVGAVGSFPHGGETDVILRPAGTPPFVPAPAGSPQQVLNTISVADARIAPPLGDVSFPEPVWPGQWHGAWALDDSGIAEVRISSELGTEGSALLHMRMPGLFLNFPDYPEAKDDRGGFGFPIPDLSPGTHVLTFTLIANDGGRTILKRTIEIRPVPTRSRAPAPARTPGR